MTQSTTYRVGGMTCGHCVGAVTQELQKIPGVSDVTVDLVPGGASGVKVASERELTEAEVRAAIDQAGYRLEATDLGSGT